MSQTPIAERLPDLKRRNYCLNVKTNMDPIFEHPVFDSARESVKCVIRQLEKPQKTFENSLCTCFKCGSNNYFPSQNMSKLLMKEHLYSTSVMIVTINGGMDGNVK